MSGLSDLSDLIKALNDSIQEAYERGRRDERQRILRLASVDDMIVTHPDQDHAVQVVQAKTRAAHGTIRPLVQQVLRAEPGLTKQEVGDRVVRLNPAVSALSAANELQRNDAKNRRGRKIYRCNRSRWYLVEDEPLEDTAGIAANDHPPLMNGAG